MLRDRKKMGTIILIEIIMLIILINKITLKHLQDKKTIQDKQENLSNIINQRDEERNQQTIVGLSNNEKEVGMSKLNAIMKNKTDKCKLIVNGEKISERELAYIDFLVNNTELTGSQNTDDIISKAIKEYTIAQDAKEKDIFLTDEENEEIEERTKKQFKRDSKEMDNILNSFHMTYDEFIEFHIAKIKRLELQTKWTLYISNCIKNGKLNTKSEEINNKCKKYNESKDEMQRLKLLLELLEDYKEDLKEKAIIEYAN